MSQKHDRLELLSRFVQSSVKDGYAITQKGLLMQCDISETMDVAKRGLLMVLFEAMFTTAFRTFYSATADYDRSVFRL